MRSRFSNLTMMTAVVAFCCFQTNFTTAQEREPANHPETGTIAAEIADEDGFATLAMAVEAAGLSKALKGEGPFTVFAPSEEAFKKVGEETLQDLLKPENKEKLVALLKAHVASGEWTAEKIAGVSEIPTVDGGSLSVTSKNEKLMVGSATIDPEKSVNCENGWIHCIDEVLPAK